MKKIIPFILFVFLLHNVFSQKIISGKSELKRLVIEPNYERGLPPDLFVNIDFKDKDGDNLLEAEESALITLTITNKGKGNAQGLNIMVKDEQDDPALSIKDGRTIPFLLPNQSIQLEFPITTLRAVKGAQHKMEIVVSEHFGYDMDPAYLLVNTQAFQEPELVFSGFEIVDVGLGTGAITEDGQIQAGEMVKAKLVVQNIGQNVSPNTTYVINSADDNIYLSDNEGNLGDIRVGEVKEFWVTISPNKRVETIGNLPLYLSMTNDFDRGELIAYNLPIKLNQIAPEPVLLAVEADMEAQQKKIVRFVSNSSKITANIQNVIDVKQVPPSLTRRPNAVAIVIGVEKYQNFINAPYAANDAELMEDYFKNILGISKVFKYTNEEVSGFFFENVFNPEYGELKTAIIAGETELFVFYSGHGMPSKNGDKVFLFPSDGRVEAIERQGFNLNKFYEDLDNMGAKSVTLFIDACFSGVSRASESLKTENLIAMKGVAIKPKVNQPWETNPNFTVFSSSAFDQTSLGFDESETGLFTYAMCAGLQGNADANGDKMITAGELAEYVRQKVEELSIRIHGLQTPQFNGDPTIVLGEF